MLSSGPAIAHAYWIDPALSIGVALVFGLLVGSFLNVVIHRLPLMMDAQWRRELKEMQQDGAADATADATNDKARDESDDDRPFNLMVPRSRCPKCGHQITAMENIPVLSWLVLRGRCSSCRTPISMRYPLIELLAGLLSALAIWWFGVTPAGIGAVGLSLALLTLTFIDLDTQLLPDVITLPLVWAGLLVNMLGAFVPLQEAVIGAMAGYLLLWSIFWLFKLLTGKEGMGYGDFKLLAALGAWFGWKAIPSIILLSSLVGATVGILLILLRSHGRENPIPFGPYLAGAGLLAMYFAGPMMSLFSLR